MSNKDPEEDLAERAIEACSNNKNAIKIKFENLCYTIDIKSTRKEILKGEPKVRKLEVLKNCSGVAFPG